MFQLTQEIRLPFITIRNYSNGSDFFNILLRKMGGVVIDGTHPSLRRRVLTSERQAIAFIESLGWEIGDCFTRPFISGDYELVSTVDIIDSFLDQWFPVEGSYEGHEF